uniref:Glyco_hydro_85 domain-containing protein n=1 Tax=Macrostomum lignano TaxID=282301 RepID=A0A1I8F7B0_9PLAT
QREETRLAGRDRLIDLADAGGFDGWLINHIVWYDSVIHGRPSFSGQNSVNCVKRRLPEAAGSILLNYCWTADLVEKSTAGRLAELQSSSSSTLTVLCRRRLLRPWLPRRRGFNCSEAVPNDCRESAAGGVGTVRARLGLRDLPIGGLKTRRSRWRRREPLESLVTGPWSFWAGRDFHCWRQPRPWAGRRLNTAFCLARRVWPKWDRARLVLHKRLEQLVGGAPDAALLAVRALVVVSGSRGAWQGGGCLTPSRLSGGVRRRGIGRQRLAANCLCRALKLVYSLDSVFEDRPLDSCDRLSGCYSTGATHPVSILAAGGGATSGSSSNSLISSLTYSVGSGGGSSQTLVFSRNCAPAKLQGDVYSEPAACGCTAARRVAHACTPEGADPALVDGNNKDATSYADKDCRTGTAVPVFLSCYTDWNRLNPGVRLTWPGEGALVRERPLQRP